MWPYRQVNSFSNFWKSSFTFSSKKISPLKYGLKFWSSVPTSSFTTAYRGTPSWSSWGFREDSSAASSLHKNHPGRRTAMITAPDLSHRDLALKVFISPVKLLSSVSSKCFRVAFSGGVRKMSVKKLRKPVMKPPTVAYYSHCNFCNFSRYNSQMNKLFRGI